MLVFANGRIVRELYGTAISEEAIIAASFTHTGHTGAAVADRDDQERLSVSRHLRRLVDAAPFVGLAIVLAVMIGVDRCGGFGLSADLLLMPALSLVLVTEAQMFVVGGSEIDLGVGAFARPYQRSERHLAV